MRRAPARHNASRGGKRPHTRPCAHDPATLVTAPTAVSRETPGTSATPVTCANSALRVVLAKAAAVHPIGRQHTHRA